MSKLSSDEWQAVSPYLDYALTLDEDERAAWVATLREQNKEIADRVQALLKRHRVLAGEGFLADSPARPAEPGLLGRRIGAYQLIAPIGQGGMGTVWLAKRSDGRFERQAAIKFVSLNQAGQGGQDRFKREGSILGRLVHPHIAELLDAGVSDEGQPYLVLEHIEGEPIDVYCDQRRLNAGMRIRFFLDVLAAVAYAHANLIVHRDVKPSNVLVRNDGQVKLLDFGIAKLLGDERNPASAATITMEGGGALTPQFAAPEQITGGAITTATDVYALGVLLYLLLTGQHPAGPRMHSPAELVKAIVETESPRASSTIKSSDGRTLAEKRDTTPEKLQRQLRGDLDTIIGKALKKAPQERYASVTAFAEDLQRYLNHEPIGARPDTLAYRVGKFARRNRLPVALSAIATILVIGSLTTGLLVANSERKVAEHRFDQVRQLANKFIALDNDIRGLPGSTQVRMKMVNDSLEYLTSLGNESHLDKNLALEIAYAYVRVAHAQGDPTSPNLGQFAEAKVSLNHASTFVDRVFREDPGNQRALFIAATISHDRMVLADMEGRREDASAYVTETASLVERFMEFPKIDPHDVYSMAYFLVGAAATSDNCRHFEDAIRYCRRGLRISESVAAAHRVQGSFLVVLGDSLWQSGDLNGALSTEERAVSSQQSEAANGHATLRSNLANSLWTKGVILGRRDGDPSMGREPEALDALKKALDIAEDLANKDPLDNLGRHDIAIFALDIGNILRHHEPPTALAVYDRAISRIREVKPNSSTRRDEAQLLAASAYCARWEGHGAQAQQRIDKALQVLRDAQKYPTDKIEPMSDVYDVLRAQADNYAEIGRNDQAISAYRQLLAKLLMWNADPQNDLRDATCISRTWSALADLLRRAGQAEEAGRLEAERTELWTHWKSRLPDAEFLLRQSLLQITPPARHRPAKPPQTLDPR